MTDEWQIRERLEYILESSCTPEEACAKCPELLTHVRNRLEQVRHVEDQLDMLFPSSNEVAENKRDINFSAGQKLPQIEGYDIQNILGCGGMGVVYTARHLRLNRIVALKMLIAGPYASRQEVARFVRESQTVAGLQHPNIVQLHDFGDLDGRPFFTMEFVDGGSLAEDLAGAPQHPRRAAELTVTLARAIQAAHSQGVIHRDLKPANILLSGDGSPKIADFGLARHVEGDPKLTISGARLGTPSYMAPEQALGDSSSIGPAADLYALGAILYEMLTGRPPFRAATAMETERQVILNEPVRPSRLNASVPKDLETICLKCLQKDFSRRYATAAELADDVQRFLNGQPVLARPVSSLYRVCRWCKRNQAVAAALAGIALLLSMIVIGSVWAATHFHKLEGEQRILADQKGKLLIEKERERTKAVEAEQRETGLRQESEAQGRTLRRNLYLSEMTLGGQAATVAGGVGRVREILSRWEDDRPDLRNWEWYYLNSLCHRSLLTRIGHTHGVFQVAWSPDGGRLASAGADKTICIWDGYAERPSLRLIGHKREVFSISWSPDGQRLVSASWDNTVRVWDVQKGIELNRFEGHTAEVYAVAWNPKSDQIASAGRDRVIHIWNTAKGSIQHSLRGHDGTVAGLAWSPDGLRLASAAHDATLRVWDVATEKAIHTITGHTNWVNHVEFSPDGARLASCSNDNSLRIWNPNTGQELQKFIGHTKSVTSVCWSPDGAKLATSSDDRTVKLWSTTTGKLTFSLRSHTAPISTIAWNPNKNHIASAGYDGTVRIWDASAGPEVPVLAGHESSVEAVAWCHGDSKNCVSGDANGVVKIWDMSTRLQKSSFQGDHSFVYSIALHPADSQVAVASGNGLIRIWDMNSGKELKVLTAHEGTAYAVAWSPDGKRIASGGLDRNIHIWDGRSGQVLRTIKGHLHSVYSLAWSPDGRHLASASGDRTVKIWDVDIGEELHCYQGHTSEVTTVAWSPDGKWIASGGYDQTVQLWDFGTYQKTTVLRGHTSHIARVHWSADGSRLASACRDGTVKIWDTATGNEALNLECGVSQMNVVAWSPDGMTLLTAADDHNLRIYDATKGYIAARAASLLPIIDRRLAIDASRSDLWLLRAEIFARQKDWKQAEVDAKQFLVRKPESNWLVFDALFAGPYSVDLNLSYPLESTDFFSAEEHENFQQPNVKWKTVQFSKQGLIDFRPLLEHRDQVSGFAMFPIYSIDDHQVAVLLGADDQAVMWLNGQRIYQSMQEGEAVPDADAVPCSLKQGWNSLLVRVSNKTADHALYLRLSDTEDDLTRSKLGPYSVHSTEVHTERLIK